MLWGLILLFGISKLHGANIFAIVHYQAKSHFAMTEPLLKRLAEKGHNVDVATHHPTETNISNYNQLSLIESLPATTNNLPASFFRDCSLFGAIHLVTTALGIDTCKAVMNSTVLKNLKKTTKKYDLVIVHISTSECMAGFGHFFNAPLISFVSGVTFPWASDRIGNPDNPSYISNYFMHSPKSLFQRIKNVYTLTVTKFLFFFLSSKASNQMAKQFFGIDTPSLEDLTKNSSSILVGNHFSMDHSRPAVPKFIEIGGIHIAQPKKLSTHFEKLLASDTGMIYLSMGSMLMSESFKPEKLQAMFDALAELPYRVLWKADQKKFPKNLIIPKNIYFEKWTPQFDILCHPNVKLFITHGGLLGSQEAVYCGVPRLGIPLWFEQEANIRAAENLGIAIEVAYDDISKKSILEAIREIIENPTYHDNAKRVSRIFKDRPLTPLDQAVYWVEYALNHKEISLLQSDAADFSWYQYYLIDVMLTVAVFFGFALFLLNLLLQFVKRLIVKKTGKKSN